MKNIEEHLNGLQKTVMNTEEKGAIRGAVVSYMQENPQKTIAVRNSADSRLHYRTSNINNSLIKKTRMIIAIIVALMLGGGTSFAAEGALPGDVLYPIKIHVNENVQELVAVSDEAEAKVQAKLAARRLEEAEKLAIEGRLNTEISADLNTRFEEHSEKSKERRGKIKESDDMDAGALISSDIEASLKTHERILEDLGDEKPEMRGFIGGMLNGIRLHLKGASDDRIEIEAKVFAGMGSDVKSSAEGALKAAQNKIDEVTKFLESKKASMSAHVQAETSAHLKEANAAVAEGKAKIEAQAYGDAFALFKKAAREAQEAKMFADTAGELKIELKNNGEVRIETEGEHNSVKIEGGVGVEDKDETHTGTDIKIETSGGIETHSGEDGVSGKSETKINLGL